MGLKKHCQFFCWLTLACALAGLRAETSPVAQSGLEALVARDDNAGFAFPKLIKAISGYHVIPWDGEQAAALQRAAEATLLSAQERPVKSGRVNEVGLAVEKRLQAALEAEGFVVDIPRTQSGRRQSAGYPDLVARKDGEIFYVEVKCFSKKTENSTQRSFYLSATDDPKVREAAIHLLFGFQVSEFAEDCYRIDSFEVLDLAGLVCELKLEFNASNRDLYNGDLTILKSSDDS
ncbi:hypothetical protein [Cerasicoccus maritimus]|uniref:hypothetical protein n=1 Tax=Cerasicoccus maritimus TaxID=490089 RepID=UPI0028524ECE|nr:hypothetical protein [Cerasicoccus maritimus]